MSTNIKYQQWLDKKIATRFIFGLERMHIAIDHFKPCTKATHIQFLGTNGKGSCIEFSKNILQAHNKKVATYTSPHLFNLYDRFKINDQSISENDFCKYLAIIQAAEEQKKISILSYFECLTLLAYLYFCEQDLDFILIEAGLGGRLDATSAFSYEHRCFTSIDYDHQSYLGSNISDIAQEKLSVISEFSSVFSYMQHSKVEKMLLELCLKQQVSLVYLQQDVFLNQRTHQTDFELQQHTLENVNLTMQGQHQFYNALLASSLCETLLHAQWNSEYSLNALNTTQRPGRYQLLKLKSGHSITVDIAHNQQSFAALMQTSQKDNFDCYFVSMLQDKPWESILKTLIEKNKPIYLCCSDSERTWHKKEILNFIAKYRNKKIHFKDSIEQSVNSILKNHKTCLAFGSFFFIGPLIQHIDQDIGLV